MQSLGFLLAVLVLGRERGTQGRGIAWKRDNGVSVFAGLHGKIHGMGVRVAYRRGCMGQ